MLSIKNDGEIKMDEETGMNLESELVTDETEKSERNQIQPWRIKVEEPMITGLDFPAQKENTSQQQSSSDNEENSCGFSLSRWPSPEKGLIQYKNGEKRPICETCGNSFTTCCCLSAHRRIHSSVKRYSCKECGKSFSRFDNLKRHERSHTGVSPYICNECGKSFNSVSHLTTHRHIHTGVKPHVCDECGKSFNHASHLTRHRIIHTDVKPYTCAECGKSYTQSSSLNCHQRKLNHSGLIRHMEERPCFNDESSEPNTERTSDSDTLQCDECGRLFTRLASLQSHQRTHMEDGLGSYASEECVLSQQQDVLEQSSDGSRTVNRKIRAQTTADVSTDTADEATLSPREKTTDQQWSIKQENKGGVCQIEKESLFSITQEKRKSLSEGEEEQINIKIELSSAVTEVEETRNEAEQVAIKDETLQSDSIIIPDQMETYRSEVEGPNINPALNEDCSGEQQISSGNRKTSSGFYQSTLKSRYKNEKKQHICETCGNSFARASCLKIHQRIHLGLKPYSCEQCGKSFSHSGNLKTHERIHTGARLYICSECGKSFMHATHLSRHKHIHKRVKPYICAECGQSFTQSTNFNIHQLKLNHSGLRGRYSCDKCGESFRFLSSLKSHQCTHIYTEQDVAPQQQSIVGQRSDCSRTVSRGACMQRKTQSDEEDPTGVCFIKAENCTDTAKCADEAILTPRQKTEVLEWNIKQENQEGADEVDFCEIENESSFSITQEGRESSSKAPEKQSDIEAEPSFGITEAREATQGTREDEQGSKKEAMITTERIIAANNMVSYRSEEGLLLIPERIPPSLLLEGEGSLMKKELLKKGLAVNENYSEQQSSNEDD